MEDRNDILEDRNDIRTLKALCDIDEGQKRLAELDRLIAAGWGFHPGEKIPRAVERAAGLPAAVVPLADPADVKIYREAGEMRMAKCVTCGGEFKGRVNARTCSEECRHKYRRASLDAHNAKHRGKPKQAKLCAWCDEPFEAWSNVVCCSRECSRARKREKDRISWKNYMEKRNVMMDFSGKISSKALEYKQEDLHAG